MRGCSGDCVLWLLVHHRTGNDITRLDQVVGDGRFEKAQKEISQSVILTIAHNTLVNMMLVLFLRECGMQRVRWREYVEHIFLRNVNHKSVFNLLNQNRDDGVADGRID